MRPLAGRGRRVRRFDRRCLAKVTGVGARQRRRVVGGGIRRGAFDLGVGIGVGLRAGEVLAAATAVLAGLSLGLDRRLGVAELKLVRSPTRKRLDADVSGCRWSSDRYSPRVAGV